MIPLPPIRAHVRGVCGVFGTAFDVLPETTPRPVFVARPNPPIYAEDGQRLDVPQGTANEGHGDLVAWLYEIGSDERRYAWVMLPSSREPREVPAAWVHDAGKVSTIRIWPTPPWRSAVAGGAG